MIRITIKITRPYFQVLILLLILIVIVISSSVFSGVLLPV